MPFLTPGRSSAGICCLIPRRSCRSLRMTHVTHTHIMMSGLLDFIFTPVKHPARPGAIPLVTAAPGNGQSPSGIRSQMWFPPLLFFNLIIIHQELKFLPRDEQACPAGLAWNIGHPISTPETRTAAEKNPFRISREIFSGLEQLKA